MKREDIIKASFEYKREVELIEGNFHSNINLNSVAVAFREGVGWFIDSVWHDKKVKPKVGELIVCVHEKGNLWVFFKKIKFLYRLVRDVFCIVSMK